MAPVGSGLGLMLRLLLCLAAGAVAPGIVDGPAYSVQLMTGAIRPDGSEPDNVRTVVMTKKGGKKYRCYLPKEPSTDAPETEEEDAPPPHMAIYLSSLLDTCFYRLEGWWTYELCISGSIRQFHQDRTQLVKPGQQASAGAAALLAAANLPKALGTAAITQDYTLGVYFREPPEKPAEAEDDTGGGPRAPAGSRFGGPSAANMAALRGEIAEEVPSKQRYFGMKYGNGTQCDMTGRPREAEVRVFCSRPDEPSHIASIEEVSTCKYVVQFRTPLHCRHPSFDGQKRLSDTVHIKCEPLDAEGRALPATPKWTAPAAPVPDRLGQAGLVTWMGDGRPGGAVAARGWPAPVVTAAPAPPALFEVGQCFLHRRYNYRGVIVQVDRRCEQSEAWIASMHIDKLKHGREQPFYHVLPDTRDRPGAATAYVPHELLLLDTPPEPLQHPLTSSLFARFDAASGRYIPATEVKATSNDGEAEEGASPDGERTATE